VTAELTATALVIRLRPLQAAGALRRRVEVPRANIAGARLVPRREATDLLGWRVGGTYLSRNHFIGGYFTVRGVKGGRQWWAAPAGDPVLLVELRDHRWTRVVIRTPDQAALAQQLAGVDGT
jgi:hypothetical protein